MGPLDEFLYAFIQIYELLIFGRIIGSWFQEFQRTRIYHFLYTCTEPYLGFFRKIMPPIGMIDISPLVGLILLYLLKEMLR
ncbi:MAG: YggT family protein [Chlamydiales bacterium]|nr:YggT family protein [Chlamydiales bacterium]NCF71170.1 YggT family protein [Chlamydiales bacterium]